MQRNEEAQQPECRGEAERDHLWESDYTYKYQTILVLEAQSGRFSSLTAVETVIDVTCRS